MKIYKVGVMFLFHYFSMKKLPILLSAIFGLFIWFTFAELSILTPSYTVNWDNVKLYWTDVSNWWYVSIDVSDSSTNGWRHMGEIEMSQQEFEYKKPGNWDQKIRMYRWDKEDEIYQFTIKDGKTNWSVNREDMENLNQKSGTTETKAAEDTTANRTVIPVVPKTGPSGTLIGIILAALAIFGGYIYIRKKADI